MQVVVQREKVNTLKKWRLPRQVTTHAAKCSKNIDYVLPQRNKPIAYILPSGVHNQCFFYYHVHVFV